MSVAITPIFAGLLALLHVPITIIVGARRMRTGISFLGGDDTKLLHLMRAHGNFAENVPIALIAMAAAELSLAPSLMLVLGGCSLVLGRVLHYVTVVRGNGMGLGRGAGMALTLTPTALWGAWALLAPWL